MCRLEENVELPRNLERPPVVPPARHRLILPWDKWGWDATTVYHAASKGLRGFRIAGAEPTCQTPSKICADVCTTTDKAVRWGIAFAHPGLPHHRSFLRLSSLTGPLASTLDCSEAAGWNSPAEAEEWMLGAGLDPDQPVDGVGWRCVWPSVAELPFGRLPPGAVVFEFPRAAPAVEPAPVKPAPAAVEPPWAGPVAPAFEEPPVGAKPRRSRELVGQLTFEFV